MRRSDDPGVRMEDAHGAARTSAGTIAHATLRAEVIERAQALDPWLARWDELAVTARRPYMSPAWALAWWRHLRPRDAELRVVVAAAGDALVGVMPSYVTPGRPRIHRMLGMPYDAPKEPLATPGAEADVAVAMTEALLSGASPADGIEVAGLSVEGPWRTVLASAGRGAHPVEGPARRVPFLTTDAGTYDAWFASKSRNFRQQMRRARRGFEAKGGRLGLAADAEHAAALLEPLLTLHAARWRSRGGSNVIRPGILDMLTETVTQLGTPERARVWFADVDGRVVSAHLFLAAGGRASYWLGGIDDDWAPYHLGMLCLLDEVAHAFAVGERIVDLGPGPQGYKARLASAEEVLVPTTFVPKGPGYPGRRLAVARHEAMAVAAKRIPKDWRTKVRALSVARPRSSGGAERAG